MYYTQPPGFENHPADNYCAKILLGPEQPLEVFREIEQYLSDNAAFVSHHNYHLGNTSICSRSGLANDDTNITIALNLTAIDEATIDKDIEGILDTFPFLKKVNPRPDPILFGTIKEYELAVKSSK